MAITRSVGNDIYIIDNFIPTLYQNYLERYYLGNSVPWERQENIANVGEEVRVGYHYLIGTYTTDFLNCNSQFQFTLPMVFSAFHHAGIPFDAVAMFRALKTEPIYSDMEPVHVDMDIDHWVCLYYPHTSDGDTVFMNERVCDIPIEESVNYNFTEKTRVTPKKGRAVIFNGQRYHGAFRSSKNTRVVLNCDVLVK